MPAARGVFALRISTSWSTSLTVTLVALVHGLAGADQVKFAVVGDFGVGSIAAQNVAALVATESPDYVVSTGDNNYLDVEPGSPDWDLYPGTHYGQYMLGRSDKKYSTQTSAEQRFFPTVGNHDTGASSSTPGVRDGYLDFFHDNPGHSGGRLPPGRHAQDASFYDVRLGDVHLFSLDSQSALMSNTAEEQHDWLAEQTAQSDATWKFVTFHHAAFTSSIAHGSHPVMQFPFDQFGIDAVFNGHDHVYERLSINNVAYFVVGNGGQPPYPFGPTPIPGSIVRFNSDSGALFVTINGPQATFTHLTRSGEIIDQFVLTKPIPEPATAALPLLLITIAVSRYRQARPAATQGYVPAR